MAQAVHLHPVHGYQCCVFVLQVEFERFKDVLILVLSSSEETLAKDNPPRPGNIILFSVCFENE